MKKLATIMSVMLCLAIAATAIAEKLYIFSEGSAISGWNVVNKDGVDLGYCAVGLDGKLECDLKISLIPAYLYDGGIEDPPEWEPSESNAVDTCRNCHREQVDEGKPKFLFANWIDNLHGDHDEKQCIACHSM